MFLALMTPLEPTSKGSQPSDWWATTSFTPTQAEMLRRALEGEDLVAVAIHETASKHDLDLMHAHYAIPHATSAWIAREMLLPGRELPIVTTLHGTDITLVGLHPSYQLDHALLDPALAGAHRGIRVPARGDRERLRRPARPHPGDPQLRRHQALRRGRQPCHRTTLAPGGEKL